MADEKIYRGMSRTELDAAYDNTSAVFNSAELLAGFNERSAALRGKYPEHLNLPYGLRERQKIDYFSSGEAGAPLFVFIHGGYWQMRAKETFSFLAAGPLSLGFDVALIGYTLAPAQTLRGIVEEVKEAIAWLRSNAPVRGADCRRIVVSGWSAGGHLAAMMLNEEGVAGALAISGIFDLEPVSLCYLNDKLCLTGEEIEQLSPLRLPFSKRPLIAVCGSEELPELQRQTWDFARRRAGEHLPGGALTLAGHNHFTILQELDSADGKLTRLLPDLAQLTLNS